MTNSFVDSPKWRNVFACNMLSKQLVHLETLATKSKTFCGGVTLFAIAMSFLYYFGICKNEQYLWVVSMGVIITSFVSLHWALDDIFDYQPKLNCIVNEYANDKEEPNSSSASLTHLYRIGQTFRS